MTKQRSIPSGLTESKSNEYGIVYYSTVKKEAMGFSGSKSKSGFYSRFYTYEMMMAHVNAFLDRAKKDGERVKEIKEKSAAYDATKDFKAGDIVYNTWGWEQTNISYFKVMNVSKKFLTMVELEGVRTESSPLSMSGYVVPVIDKVIGKPEKHSVWMYSDEPRVRFKYGSGQKWDGKPKSCSWYA